MRKDGGGGGGGGGGGSINAHKNYLIEDGLRGRIIVIILAYTVLCALHYILLFPVSIKENNKIKIKGDSNVHSFIESIAIG